LSILRLRWRANREWSHSARACRNIIVAPQSSVAAIAAHKATKTIPIVFSVTTDPVKLGLVASLSRPGGNATGINSFSSELSAKRVGLLRELLPASKSLAVLFNPQTQANHAAIQEVRAAAATLGLQVRVVNSSTTVELDQALKKLELARADARLVINDPLFTSSREKIALSATRHGLPTMLSQREYVEAGGLMSYGTDSREVYRQVGAYTGRILRGTKPSDLPVEQSSKFELVINIRAAKALGLEIPPTLLARADEVIE
jgi:putative ABC transport system substrate-binding protein